MSDTEDEKSEMEKRIETAIFNLMPAITDTDFPFLGCCYGIGILAHHLGARVSKDRFGEAVGAVECQVTTDGTTEPLLKGLPGKFMAFVGHKEGGAGTAAGLFAPARVRSLPLPDDPP